MTRHASVLGVVAALMLARAAPVLAANGVLKISSFPSGARVVVDGLDTGKTTPLSISLPEGDHTVTIAIPESGWNPDTRTVTILAGNNDLSVTLLPVLTQGPQGPRGDPGPQGPQGVQGDKGDKGDPGTSPALLAATSEECPTGGTAVVGADGRRMPICNGAQGSQGLKGDTGDQGVPGVDGRDGLPGQDGQPGLDGQPGEKGDPGAPAQVEAATTSECPTGGVIVSDTLGNRVPVCSGAPGPAGMDGRTGPAGPPGAAVALDEATAMAVVGSPHHTELFVSVQGSQFRSPAYAVSRVGLDVQYHVTRDPRNPSADGTVTRDAVTFPRVTLQFPNGRLLDFDDWWTRVLAGGHMDTPEIHDVRLDLDYDITLLNCVLESLSRPFNGGVFVKLRPQGISVTLPAGWYPQTDLDRLLGQSTGVGAQLPPDGRLAPLWAYSGGAVETVAESAPSGTPLRLEVSPVFMRMPANGNMWSWINAVLTPGSSAPYHNDFQLVAASDAETFRDAFPVRVSFINPLLVSPSGEIPPVWDVTMKPRLDTTK